MKKMIVIAAVAISSVFIYKATDAQVRVNVNFNIGSQPLWGPAGYDYAQYYYLPDIGAYYSIAQRQFIYNRGGRWIFARTLPPVYGNFDLYRSYKVVINEPNPWLHHDRYYTRYASFRGNRGQVMIRDSRDRKYWQVKGHPRYADWRRDNGRYSDYREARDNDPRRNGRGRGR